MDQSKLSKIIAKLKFAYPYYFKDMERDDIYAFFSLYQEQLSEFNYETLNNAINSLIKTNKYMPAISEIYEYCKLHYKHKEDKTIEKMIMNNYFSNDNEIEKAYRYIETGKIPEWFKLDYEKEKRILIGG